MTQTRPPARRFGPEFVETQRRRYGNRPPEQRQLSYDIAVQDEFAPWRDWLDQQFALLPPAAADDLAGKLWLDEHFWTVMIELAAGAGSLALRAVAPGVRNRGGDLLPPAVIGYEEPRLRAQFGEQYEAYRRTASRWIPRPPCVSSARALRRQGGDDAANRVHVRGRPSARRGLRVCHRPLAVRRVAGRRRARAPGGRSTARRGNEVHHHPPDRARRADDDAADHGAQSSQELGLSRCRRTVPASTAITVEPLGDGTRSRVTVALDFEGHGIGKLLPLDVIRRIAAKGAPRSYWNLKERLERGAWRRHPASTARPGRPPRRSASSLGRVRATQWPPRSHRGPRVDSAAPGAGTRP
jgi:hypothetical protein